MCELLNQAFGVVCTKEDLSDISEATREYNVNGRVMLCDINIDGMRVMQVLDTLREDKAAGADELVPRFLSKIKYQLARQLTMLFNNIMKSGQVPAHWKEANVIPVFKGRCRNVATNYRPVSLTSQLSKGLKRLLETRLLNFLRLINL